MQKSEFSVRVTVRLKGGRNKKTYVKSYNRLRRGRIEKVNGYYRKSKNSGEQVDVTVTQ